MVGERVCSSPQENFINIEYNNIVRIFSFILAIIFFFVSAAPCPYYFEENGMKKKKIRDKYFIHPIKNNIDKAMVWKREFFKQDNQDFLFRILSDGLEQGYINEKNFVKFREKLISIDSNPGKDYKGIVDSIVNNINDINSTGASSNQIKIDIINKFNNNFLSDVISSNDSLVSKISLTTLNILSRKKKYLYDNVRSVKDAEQLLDLLYLVDQYKNPQRNIFLSELDVLLSGLSDQNC